MFIFLRLIQAPHHSAVSWTNQSNRCHDIKVLITMLKEDFASSDSKSSNGSDSESTDSEDDSMDDSSSGPAFTTKKGSNASESTGNDDSSDMGKKGTPFTDADRRRIAKWMSEFSVKAWSRMDNKERWDQFSKDVRLSFSTYGLSPYAMMLTSVGV